MNLGYDPADPPREAPIGADRLLWGLAWQGFVDHVPTDTGICRTCLPETAWPCGPRIRAEAGLQVAVYVNLLPTAEHPYMPVPRGANPRHNGPAGRLDQWEGFVAEAIPPQPSPLQVDSFPPDPGTP
jgi:hypothetical protein